jgi:hypothetical protein
VFLHAQDTPSTAIIFDAAIIADVIQMEAGKTGKAATSIEARLAVTKRRIRLVPFVDGI